MLWKLLNLLKDPIVILRFVFGVMFFFLQRASAVLEYSFWQHILDSQYGLMVLIAKGSLAAVAIQRRVHARFREERWWHDMLYLLWRRKASKSAAKWWILSAIIWLMATLRDSSRSWILLWASALRVVHSFVFFIILLQQVPLFVCLISLFYYTFDDFSSFTG